jgi:dTDP-4-dehydrorhamnose 3,5-epimerase
MKKITITKLKTVPTEGGRVRHIIKKSEDDTLELGEAYFSYIEQGQIRGWKKHSKMTMNLVVPSGNVRFVFQLMNSQGVFEYKDIVIGEENYVRINVPPNIWFAFQGIGFGESIILNISNIEHDPEEAENLPLNAFPYF